MSDSKDSTVTYTSVSSPFEGRSGDISPGVDGPLVMPEDPYAYVIAAFQAPPSLDYPVYPEFMPEDDEVFLAEEQPLPAAALPTDQSPGDDDDEEGGGGSLRNDAEDEDKDDYEGGG
ncbi:hypothetical protein Tco_1154460 [Tanacetum coccineum]